MKRACVLGLVLSLAGIACDNMTPPPPASAILAGRWNSTNLEDLELTLTFDDDGILTLIEATRPSDGATALLEPDEATSEVDGSDVTITVPADDRQAVYTATLADDENTLSGSLSAIIELENGVVEIPQGELVLERESDGDADPCADITCSNGESCVDGVCVADDPCADVTCDEGEVCSNGVCVPADEPVVDAAAGEAFLAANCAACHGADGGSGFAPDIRGLSADELQAGLEGAAVHDALTVTAEDFANLAAYLAGSTE